MVKQFVAKKEREAKLRNSLEVINKEHPLKKGSKVAIWKSKEEGQFYVGKEDGDVAVGAVSWHGGWENDEQRPHALAATNSHNFVF